jgi:hypothetical protein
MTRKAAWLGLALAAVSYGQEQRTMEVNVGGPPPAARREAEPKKMTPEQMKRGRAWMESAEAQAKGLEGGMRAYALLQISRSYGPAQKAHALELLEDALGASRAIDTHNDLDGGPQTRDRLQRQIVEAMVPLAPERADELLTTLDPRGREFVLRALLGHYRKTKQDDRALEMVYRIAAEREFPYGAGSEMMRELPKEKHGELQQMFTTAFESYKNHKHEGMTLGSGDFPNMIVEFHPLLSPDLVKAAIAEVLRQAQEPEQRENGQIQVASAQGAVAMASAYEYRLFQLMPALRAVDADEADRLLKKNREVAGMLEKYPEGASQLMQGGPGRRGGGGSVMMVGGGPGPGGRGMPDREETARLQKIVADAEAHPADALANAATLSVPEYKVNALEGIARATWKKNPGVAKSALKQMLETLPQLEPQRQTLSWQAAAGMYREMGEAAEARKTIEKGLEAAAKLYKQDTDANDPNQALEAYWPSANAYAGLLRVAAEMDPNWALEQLKELPDDQLKTLARIAMANALLGQPVGQVMIVSAKKDGTNMMMQSVD